MYFIALKFKVENNKKYDREINHNEKNEWWLVCTVLSQDVSTFRENKWDLFKQGSSRVYRIDRIIIIINIVFIVYWYQMINQKNKRCFVLNF